MAEMPPRNYLRVKVLSLGEMGVGKSCLIKRYCEQKFNPRYIATIGVDFGVRSVTVDDGSGSSQEVKVNFWDLSGDVDYSEVRNEFAQDTQGALLVYDVTDRKSYLKLDSWLDELSRNEGRPIVTAVCANKVDDAANRQVTEEEGRKWAELRGNVQYFETSAKSGQDVNAVFSALLHGIVAHLNERARRVG